MEGRDEKKKMEILCLHGFRTSGSFLQGQISKWDASILDCFDMVFPNGIYPAGGKSDIEGIYPPPYFEWFQFSEDSKNIPTWMNAYPIYGAALSALLLGYQAQGKVLKDHPKFKLFISISGNKFRTPNICKVAYKDIIEVNSVHFIGAKDHFKLHSGKLAALFKDPLIISHPQGHTVPRLDETTSKQLLNWTIEMQTLLSKIPDEEDTGAANKSHQYVSDVYVKPLGRQLAISSKL